MIDLTDLLSQDSFISQMAWTSPEEQTLTHLHEHLFVARPALKSEIVSSVKGSLFRWTLGWDHEDWTTDRDVTVVTIFGDAHLDRNLKFALVKEMVGMELEHYCVIDSDLPDFEHRLIQVLKYLPSHKVCLYPPRTSLGGPFLHHPGIPLVDSYAPAPTSKRRCQLPSAI